MPLTLTFRRLLDAVFSRRPGRCGCFPCRRSAGLGVLEDLPALLASRGRSDCALCMAAAVLRRRFGCSSAACSSANRYPGAAWRALGCANCCGRAPPAGLALRCCGVVPWALGLGVGAVHVDLPASGASPAVAGCAWLCDPAPGGWFSV